MSNLTFDAMLFAHDVHRDQVRKYTNEPYFAHLAEVAGIVGTVAGPDLIHTMTATAWLHDCIEDQGVEHSTLKYLFGITVADAVLTLSDLETGNRKERKAASRERLAKAKPWVQTIKVADMISNTKSIVTHDPKFAKTYLKEKRLLVDVLTEADPKLLSFARMQLDNNQQ